MKTIIRSLAVTLLAFFMLVTAFPVTASAEEAGFEPRLSSPSRSNAYYNRELNAYSQTGYGMPNCVAYAYGRIYEITGKKPKITHGSAGDWWFINKNNGYYEYGSEPELGAVACWSNHVAVVEKIEGSTVTASQSHWGGRYFDTTVFESGTNRFGQKFYGYIYMSRGYFEEIEREKEEEIRRDAEAIFRAMDCYGLSRVDFFLTKDTEEVVFNEINTLPGFTAISMYPMLWEAEGVDKKELIQRLIDLAMVRYDG